MKCNGINNETIDGQREELRIMNCEMKWNNSMEQLPNSQSAPLLSPTAISLSWREKRCGGGRKKATSGAPRADSPRQGKAEFNKTNGNEICFVNEAALAGRLSSLWNELVMSRRLLYRTTTPFHWFHQFHCGLLGLSSFFCPSEEKSRISEVNVFLSSCDWRN